MTGTPRGDQVDLESWDLGDVLAVVEQPKEYAEKERPGIAVDIVNAAVGVAGSTTVGMAAGLVVPLVLLAVKGLRSEGPRPHVALMSIDDARRLAQRELLFFPEGGPNVHDVYARHPLRRRDYVPFATFHRLLLNEKAIEAAQYLLSLGARDVEITWQESTGKTAKGEAGVALPTADDVSLTTSFARDETGRLAIRITGAGKAKPEVPGLIWPARDPMFKLAHTVAQAGAETFHFGIKTEQSATVNAAAAVKLKSLNFSLGGDYKRWEDLTFTVDATFPSGA